MAELVLNATEHGTLNAILPMELADYRTDFATAESQAEFQSLLDRADLITFPDQLPSPIGNLRNAAAIERPRSGPASSGARPTTSAADALS